MRRLRAPRRRERAPKVGGVGGERGACSSALPLPLPLSRQNFCPSVLSRERVARGRARAPPGATTPTRGETGSARPPTWANRDRARPRGGARARGENRQAEEAPPPPLSWLCCCPPARRLPPPPPRCRRFRARARSSARVAGRSAALALSPSLPPYSPARPTNAHAHPINTHTHTQARARGRIAPDHDGRAVLPAVRFFFFAGGRP